MNSNIIIAQENFPFFSPVLHNNAYSLNLSPIVLGFIISREVVTLETEYPFPQLCLQMSDKSICSSSRQFPTTSAVPRVDHTLVPIAMSLLSHLEIITRLFKRG